MSNLRVSCHKISMYLFILAIILACSNDIDVLTDAVLNDPEVPVEELNNDETEGEEQNEGEEHEEGGSNEEGPEDDFESRVTDFPPTEDAYIQSGKGYDQSIIRLDENNRTSYLKFDLEAIDTRGGYITDVSLEFTVEGDAGSGTINVYKGIDSDWTEQEIDNKNAPEIDILLGSLTKEYKIGSTEEIVLSGSDVIAEKTSLILQHKNGNDLAIASKEHPSKKGPKLRVNYRVPKGANPIIIAEEEPAPPTEDDPPAEDETPEEETPEENEAPMAIADASPSGGQVPLAVSFTGSNSTDDKAIASYVWDFKDGSTATTANPEHTYTEIGTFEAELTVTDADGLSNTDTVTITVTEEDNAAPVAKITADPLSGEVPLEVDFTGSNSTDDNAIESYSWNFKDGSTASNANPTHTFSTAGTYAVELTVTDEHGLSDKETVTITVNEPSNEAPVARASANPTSGTAPLEVSFNGSSSTDDHGVTSYSWNFKDGSSSNNTNPTHTFTDPGTYTVELTVSDENGLTNKDTVTITVNAPQNSAPNAAASASVTEGDAPLQVNFSASNSTDDNGIVSYHWQFPGSSSSSENASYTFNSPGVYNITLTVTDAAGLSDSDSISITVNQASNGGACVTNGGKAHERGLKTWCWDDITIPSYTNGKGPHFANSNFVVDSECDPNAVSIENGKVKFHLVPKSPPTSNNSDCYRDYNMRAEIRTNPWFVNNPLGTEEWYGFTYEFSNDYKIHQYKHWYLFQVYPGPVGMGPQVHLQTSTEGQFNGNPAGELFFYRQPADNDRNRKGTGIIPKAGDKLDIVCHFVWGIGNQGRTRLWINGQLVYDEYGSNVKLDHPYGGNLKIGIYKSGWNNLTQIEADEADGITSLTTYLGDLRILTRRPGDPGYGDDAYSVVAPK